MCALVRDPGKAEGLRRLGAEIIEGDMLREETWSAGLDGAEALVHTAAKVESWSRSSEMFDRINVEATVKLVETATARGVSAW